MKAMDPKELKIGDDFVARNECTAIDQRYILISEGKSSNGEKLYKCLMLRDWSGNAVVRTGEISILFLDGWAEKHGNNLFLTT
jgi:hypothetical protein|tara:strand:+ start:277 stop:525 length:249 start_codon:yes stop_codon:yes gene_type:complete